MRRMVSVQEAKEAIRSALSLLAAEPVSLGTAIGRTLAAPVIAQITQPPFNSSAMDGYAVRLTDVRAAGSVLKLAGVSAAGAGYHQPLRPDEAVRIFTGAPVPDGADHILIQEEAEAGGGRVVVKVEQQPTLFVRAAGIDFREGATLVREGEQLSATMLALAAAANVPDFSVRRRPHIAIIANGDELVMPGAKPGRDHVISSIQFALSPLLEAWGATASFLGIARDAKNDIRKIAEKADADIIVPVGGASVGDHDFMREVFAELGYEPIFQGVTVRPGKPTWFSIKGAGAVLGLPGNPASALVTARLFLKPAIERLLGMDADDTLLRARASKAVPANGPRETYFRAHVKEDADGVRRATVFDLQDSSLLSVMARSNALVRRETGAPAAAAGDVVEYVLL